MAVTHAPYLELHSVVILAAALESYTLFSPFTRSRVSDPLNYSLMDALIPQASSRKYLGIILRSVLSWADQVNCTVKKASEALHFTMRILKTGNSNTKI